MVEVRVCNVCAEEWGDKSSCCPKGKRVTVTEGVARSMRYILFQMAPVCWCGIDWRKVNTLLTSQDPVDKALGIMLEARCKPHWGGTNPTEQPPPG